MLLIYLLAQTTITIYYYKSYCGTLKYTDRYTMYMCSIVCFACHRQIRGSL